MSRLMRYGMLLALMTVMVTSGLLPGSGVLVHADTAAPLGDFNLQVTPSPLVTTVKPGTKSSIELKIRNGSTASEQLKIEPRAFTLSNDSTDVKLQDTTPPDIADWISFSAPKFTLLPGQWYTEDIVFNVPKGAGFSYSFALVISRQNVPKPTGGTRLINGSLAVFTLVNVDRPGATSSLSVNKFSASKKAYDYLPATFSVRFHNTGNTIVQPYGNIFIQRGKSAPLASLPVNETRGYILPGTQRTITSKWTSGFPVYQTTTDANGKSHQKLVWNWAKLSQLRIGRYTAHLVAVYNQAGRDVPIDGTVSFWVIPWKILLVLLVVVLLVLFALGMLVWGIVRLIKRRRAKHIQKKEAKQNPPAAPNHES